MSYYVTSSKDPLRGLSLNIMSVHKTHEPDYLHNSSVVVINYHYTVHKKSDCENTIKQHCMLCVCAAAAADEM